jgi:hypothetical protein
MTLTDIQAMADKHSAYAEALFAAGRSEQAEEHAAFADQLLAAIAA